MNTLICAAFNSVELTKITYESILRYTKEPYRFILIDNGSTDETSIWMSSIASAQGHHVWTPIGSCPDKHSVVTLVKSPKNEGCGIGRNIGARMVKELASISASTDYVTFIDNDIVATDGWDTEMMAFMNAHPEIGICGPSTNFAGTPQLLDKVKCAHLGHPIPDRVEEVPAFAYWHRTTNKDRWAYVPPGFVIIGFCMMIRKSCLDQLMYPDGSLFDERFKYYGKEDNDLCVRATKVGWKLAYFNGCYVHHWGSKSLAQLEKSGVDWGKTWRENDAIFAEKWGK